MTTSRDPLTSESIGDPARFLSFAELSGALGALPVAPRETGGVALLVRRRELGRREAPERLRLTPEAGMPGDAWSQRGVPNPVAQLAVIQADVARLIANGQPLPLFGDNLFLDLDLSAANLLPGSRLRVGDALLEVTPKAHNGCHKFRARFGADALRFVSDPLLRPRNLRGIYMRVLEAGDVGVGDRIAVLSRSIAAVTTG